VACGVVACGLWLLARGPGTEAKRPVNPISLWSQKACASKGIRVQEYKVQGHKGTRVQGYMGTSVQGKVQGAGTLSNMPTAQGVCGYENYENEKKKEYWKYSKTDEHA